MRLTPARMAAAGLVLAAVGTPRAPAATRIVAGQQAQTPPPVFRVAADLISVDVSVFAGNVPVSGLTTADFALWDNGVRQEIRAIATESVPLDITLVVDMSRSQARIGVPERLRAEVIQVAAVPRREDRLRLMIFATDVLELAPLQHPNPSLSVPHFESNGWSSIHDAIAAALIRPIEPPRRQLVVAFTDGYDTASVLNPATVHAIAARTEAVLHLVIPPYRPLQYVDSNSISQHNLYPPMPFVYPRMGEYDRRFQELLIAASETTGGFAHAARGNDSLVRAFKQIFDEFRQSYFLQYQLSGVPRQGSHEITVEVTRRGKYTVRARRGYFVEASR